jgi:hypothetical protein
MSPWGTFSRQLSLLIILRWLSVGVLTVDSAVGAEPPPPLSSLAGPVTVLELGAYTAAPVFQTTGERFSQLLTLTYDAKAAPGPLRVDTIPLDCDGVAVPTGLVESSSGAKPELATSASRKITILNPEPPVWVVLTATLPSVTTCSGQLRFTIGTQSYQPRPFRVTRAAPVELPVEVSGLQRVSSTPGLDNVKFSMKGPSERELKVKVGLFELGRMGETLDSRLNSNVSSWRVDPAEVTIPAGGGLADFTLQLDQLEPGKYIGKLNLAAEGYKAKLHSFSVAVRYGPWWAAFLVSVGAILALLLKRLSTRVRPRLVVRSAVSRLLASIVMQRQSYALDPQESDVLDAIQARITAVFDEAVKPGDSSVDWSDKARDRLAAEGAKVTAFTHWLNANRMLASITAMEATKRATFEQRLSAGRQALSSATALDVARVEELSKLPGDIAEEKAVLAQAAVTVAAAETATAADVTASPEAAAEFRRAHEYAQQANECLTNENYLGYREAYDFAGRAYYSGLAEELEAGIMPAPVGNGRELAPGQGVAVASGARTVLLAKVKTAPNLQTARDAYRSARAAMLPTQPPLQNAPRRVMPLAPLRDADFPDSVVREQRPLMPGMANTVVEDTMQLTARVKLLDNLVDGVAVVGAAVLGVVLIWEPNAGWGQPTDLIAAFLWGMGLHTVGSSTFEGILGVRAKLS